MGLFELFRMLRFFTYTTNICYLIIDYQQMFFLSVRACVWPFVLIVLIFDRFFLNIYFILCNKVRIISRHVNILHKIFFFRSLRWQLIFNIYNVYSGQLRDKFIAEPHILERKYNARDMMRQWWWCCKYNFQTLAVLFLNTIVGTYVFKIFFWK